MSRASLGLTGSVDVLQAPTLPFLEATENRLV